MNAICILTIITGLLTLPLFAAEPAISRDLIVEGNFHNVAIFMGDDEVNGPIIDMFSRAICQVQYSIIVDANIFTKFLTAHNDSKTDYSKVTFTDDDWLLFYGTYNVPFKYFLLIPKNYIEKQNKKFPIGKKISTGNYTRREFLTGFAIDTPEVLKQAYIRDYTSGSKEFIALQQLPKSPTTSDFYKMFMPSNAPILGLWNIYMAGHGMYPTIPLDQPLPKIIYSFVDPTQASIAGIPLLDFRSLMQIFSTKMSVNFLYYISCYAGDVNLILPYITYMVNRKGNIISGQEKPNFVIAVGALTSQAVAITKESVICTNPAINTINIGAFFQELENNSPKKTIQPTIFKDSELIKILTPLYPKREGPIANKLSGQPSVIFPKAETPRALPLNDDIAVISNVLVQKHTLEKKPIILKNKKAILIYPETIDVDIIISTDTDDQPLPAIISMLPGIAMHNIKSLQIDYKRWYKAFNIINPQFRKYFFINKMNAKNMFGRMDSIFNILISNAAEKTDILYNTSNAKIQYMTTGAIILSTLTRTFQELIKDNPLANTLCNYYGLTEAQKFDFNEAFDWKLLQQVLSPEDKKLIEAELKKTKTDAEYKTAAPTS